MEKINLRPFKTLVSTLDYIKEILEITDVQSVTDTDEFQNLFYSIYSYI